jgi:hypothetical protein
MHQSQHSFNQKLTSCVPISLIDQKDSDFIAKESKQKQVNSKLYKTAITKTNWHKLYTSE